MSTSEQLRVLLVDDTPMLAPAIRGYLEAAAAELGRQPVLEATDQIRTVQRWIEEESRTWDVALVDLHFLVGRSTGLAVLDLLSSMPTPPIPVLFTEPYDPSRLLCCVAAAAWFDVAAAYNKIGSFAGMDGDQRRFIEFLRTLLERPESAGLLPNYLRSGTVQQAFRDLFSSPESLRNWAALATEEKIAVAAAVAQVSPKAIEAHCSKVKEPVRTFWATVRQENEEDKDPAAQSIVYPATLTEEIASGVSFVVAHGFAESQILFFRDPYVQDRAARLGNRVHNRSSWRTRRS